MKPFLIIVFLLFAALYTSYATDTIIVHKDNRIDILTEKQAGINKVSLRMTANGFFKGYRLQIINTRIRDDAFKEKAKLLGIFPDQKVYILYQSPYFKVRVGNFVNRNDAENFKNQLSRYSTQPVYVIQDQIEYIPNAEDFQ